MNIPSTEISLLVAVGIVLITFYASLTLWLIPHLRRLYSFMVDMKREYQALDRGDTLTLLRDAGLSYEEALWFFEKFYAHAASWERCLIKLYVRKHCIRKVQ